MRLTTFDDHGSRIAWSDLPGHEPAIVYLHGLGGSGAAAFGHVAGHPRLGGRRALVLDLPGHGLSDRPQDFSYSLDAYAGAVSRVLDAAALDAIDLFGHSMGGSIAITLAAREPSRVHRLVVAEANLDPLPPSPTGLGSQQIFAQTEAAWLDTGYQAMQGSSPDWRPTLRIADALAVHRSAVELDTGTVPTMRENFVALRMPRTFIRGDRGEALRDPEGLEAAGVRIIVIPDAGHVMMDDQPIAFVEALVSAFVTDDA